MLEAAAKRKDKTVAAKLAKFEASRPTPAENFFALEPYLETLEGGDVAKGKKSFFENVAISARVAIRWATRVVKWGRGSMALARSWIASICWNPS